MTDIDHIEIADLKARIRKLEERNEQWQQQQLADAKRINKLRARITELEGLASARKSVIEAYKNGLEIKNKEIQSWKRNIDELEMQRDQLRADLDDAPGIAHLKGRIDCEEIPGYEEWYNRTRAKE